MSGPRLTLTVIGCAAAWTRVPGRASACYLLELDERAITLDFGQGAFSNLAAVREPASLDAIWLSHLHPDHMVDLVPLRHYLLYGLTPEGHVEIRGPADLAGRFDGLTGEAGFLGTLVGEPVRPGHFTSGPFAVEAARVTHTDSSHGFRVSAAARPDGPGLVYSGDCANANDLLPLIRPGDVLLSEAYLGALDPAPVGGHLTARAAAGAARDGQARQLILTHLKDGIDRAAALAAAAEIFPSVRLAEPGLRLEID